MVDTIILCAGLGTRLRPLTLERPKPAVPLLNRPVIGYTLDTIRALGLDRAVINTHWLPEVMAAIATKEAEALKIELAVSHEPEILGSGGGLWQARERGLIRRDRPLLILNGDVLSDCDLKRLVETHITSGALATMSLRPLPAGASYTPIEVDEGSRVRRIGKYGEPLGRPLLFFTGAHVLSPEALDRLPSGESSVIAEVYAPLLEEGAPVQGVVDEGLWLDLGDPAGYLHAHLTLWHRRGLEKLIAPTAHVAPGARLEETAVGEGATVGDGADVRQCIIWPGARVPAHVSATRHIVTEHAIVTVPGETSH